MTATATISDYELSVPARFVELFRLSVVDNITEDADRVRSESTKLSELYDAGRYDDPDSPADPEEHARLREGRLEDFSGPVSWLANGYTLFQAIAQSTCEQPVTIRGDYISLHSALQTMMRRGAKDLTDQLEAEPINGADALEGTSAVLWAAEEIQQLDARWRADRRSNDVDESDA